MQPCGSTKIVILVAAINETQNSQIYYALISVTEEGQTLTLSSYTHINHNTLFLTNNSPADLKMGLILNRGVAYAFDDKIIYQIYTNGKVNPLNDFIFLFFFFLIILQKWDVKKQKKLNFRRKMIK